MALSSVRMARRHNAWLRPKQPLWRAHHQLNDDRNPELFEGIGHWTSAYKLLQENLGGEVGKVVLIGEAVSAAEEDNVDGETSLQRKKVLQYWLNSCTR
jgi:hypothetical protein